MAVTQTLSVTEVSGSVNNASNTSKVRILWQSTQTGDSWNGYTRTAKYYVSINGGAETAYSVSYTLPQNSTKTIADVTFTITHKDDGTGSVKVRTWMDTSISAGVVEMSKTLTLTTIPRASSISSASNVTLGSTCNVKWTPNSKSFRYKINFKLGEWSYTTGVIHPNQTSAYTYASYVIPLTVANQIPNTRLGTMTATLYTYSDSNGTVSVGSPATKDFTITVPDNSNTKPTVSMSLSPVGSLPSTFAGLYIQGHTKVKATLSAEGKYGASIASYLMRVDGVYLDADDAFTSKYFITAGNRTVYGYATDKRGHTGEILKSITVIAYSDPKLENTTAVRCDKDGNVSESGTYLKISAKRSYSPVVSNGVQKNFCKIMYRYSDGLSYTPWVTILDRETLNSNEITTGALLNGNLSTMSSYTVHIKALDDIGRYAETYITIPTENVYWHRDGARNALGLGKYNERDNAIDSDWDFYMNNHKVTGLPFPTSDTDAVPMSYVDPADIKIGKRLNAKGWYKIGAITGDMCGVVTLTIGGIFVNNQASPSMVDIATQYNNARAFLRLPSLVDGQLSKIGVAKETTTVFGVYAYYNNTTENPIRITIHTHMGTFASASLAASNLIDSDMLAVVTLKG